MCAIAALQPTSYGGMCGVCGARAIFHIYPHHRPRTAGPRTAPLTYTLHRGCSTRAFCEKCHRQRLGGQSARGRSSHDLVPDRACFLRRHIAGSCICRASARQVPSRTSSHSNIIRPNVVWRSHTDTETHAQRLPSLSLYTGHSLRDRRSLLERVLSLSLSFSRVCSRRAWCCRWQAPGHPRTRSWPLALMMHAGITLASSRRACCRWRAPAPPCRRWRSWRGGRY